MIFAVKSLYRGQKRDHCHQEGSVEEDGFLLKSEVQIPYSVTTLHRC